MSTTTTLPGIDLAREVLGLDYGEIARAVQADESTLYRWRQGGSPTSVYLNGWSGLTISLGRFSGPCGARRCQSG